MLRCFLLVGFFLVPGSVFADPSVRYCSDGKWTHVQCIRQEHRNFDICQSIYHFARRHDLDPGFFARLIWQESRFDQNALSHANARGIAQFIPSTAKARGLKDPCNPAQALEHSADLLGYLKMGYGNEGLAAAGYNGGERRVDGFLYRNGGFATETLNYVEIITGFPVTAWKGKPFPTPDYRLNKDLSFMDGCLAMAKNGKLTALRKAPPKPKIQEWGVRLAWGHSRNKALAAYKRNTTNCRTVLKPEKLDLIKVKNRIRGRRDYIMAQVGRSTRKSADRLCNRIRASGCICSVFKNS